MMSRVIQRIEFGKVKKLQADFALIGMIPASVYTCVLSI